MSLARVVDHAALSSRYRRVSKGGMQALALVTLAVMSGTATAVQLEVEGGRSYMDSHPTTTLFVEGVFPDHPLGNSRLTWSPDVSVGWIDGRQLSRCDGAHYSPRDAVWLAAGGARFHLGTAGDWYRPLFFSEQLALQNRHSLALSSDYEFVSTLGWQGRHFSFQLRHVSNAGLHGPNRGETMALAGIGFDF